MLHRNDLSLVLLTADFEWKQGMLLRVEALIKAIWILIFDNILRLHYWKISLSLILQVISRNIAVEFGRRFCAFIFDSAPHPLFLGNAIYLNHR